MGIPLGSSDMGRKPRPTETLKLAGTYRSDRHAPTEAAPAPSSTSAGVRLSARASRRFAQMSKLMRDAGLLSDVDRQALACYCEAYARWYESRNRLEADGLFLTSQSGNVTKHPAISVMENAASEMLRWSVELGLTPQSRTKLPRTKTAQTPQDRLSAMISKAAAK